MNPMAETQDTCANGLAGANRPAGLMPRNERAFAFTYGAADGMDDALGRVAAIRDDNGGSPGDSLAEYAYMGIGRIVLEDYPEPEVSLDYDSGAAGEYDGFDRFGRVIDHRWYAYAASADRDRYTYGYDRASNRLYRENMLTTGRDEFYGYDQVNRLVEFARGDLNNPKSAIENPNSAEDWLLDMTGNWPGLVQKTSGTTDLDQGCTHNPVNEITAITATTGTDWADPEHDRNGNMTTIPKPANLADGLTATYDAWNRLVEVKDGQTIIARHDYDGLNRRIESHIDSGAPSNPTGIDTYVHYYHNSAWQILETRQSDTPSAQPETLQPKHQYVWSQRYIDAAVLRDENTGANGLCDDDRLYYLNDANFNVTALLDTAGDALERYVYSPYGVVTIYDPTWTNTRSTSSYGNVTLYTGRELDSETGLYYYRNRYYGAELGRFVSRDPIEFNAGDVNLYRSVFTSPVMYVDPMGEYGWGPPDWNSGVCNRPRYESCTSHGHRRGTGRYAECKGETKCITIRVRFSSWYRPIFFELPYERDLARANRIWNQCCIGFARDENAQIPGPSDGIARLRGMHDPYPFVQRRRRKFTDHIIAVYVRSLIDTRNPNSRYRIRGFADPRGQVVFIGRKATQRTLAHELGHVLLGGGHPYQYPNLMAEGGSNWEQLLPSQCDKAREVAARIFQNTTGPGPA